MSDQLADESIVFRGTDIRELPRDDLLEAVQVGFAELKELRARLSDEGRMIAAREEDFQRGIRTRKDFFGTVAELQSRTFDSAAAYNQLIVIGGYGAFFGVWSVFAKDIARATLLASGVLILISLVVYVTWTVINMYLIQSQNVAAVQTFEGGFEGFEERLQEAVAAGRIRIAKIQRFWRPVVFVAGVSALIAAAILGGAAFWSLVNSTTSTPIALVDRTANAEARATRAAVKSQCEAGVAELYSRAASEPGPRATNHNTGQHALFLAGHWQVVPIC